MKFLNFPDIPTVSSLGAAGEQGRLAVLNSDDQLYYDDGTNWINISILVIGSSVSGGGANRILFQDNSSLLSTDAGLIYNSTDDYMQLTDSNLRVVTSDARSLSSTYQIEERFGNYDGDYSGLVGIELNSPTAIAAGFMMEYKFHGNTGFSGSVMGEYSTTYLAGDPTSATLYGKYLQANNRVSSNTSAIYGVYTVAHAESTATTEAVAITGAGLKGNLNSTPLMVGVRGTVQGHYNSTDVAIAGEFIAYKQVSSGETIDQLVGVKSAVRTELGTTNDAIGISLSGWNGDGTTGVSYGIYADTSIDIGTTKYFIYSLSTSPSLFTGDVSVPDDAYNATTWDGNFEVPTKNALRDKFESLSGTSPGGSDTQIQFNDGGVFAGDSKLTFDKTANIIGTEGISLSGADPFIRYGEYANGTGSAALFTDTGGVFTITTWSDFLTPAGSSIKFDTPLLNILGCVIAGGLVPETHDGYDLGSSAKAWAGLYLGPDEVIHFNNVGIFSQLPTTKHTLIDTANTAGAKVLIKNQQGTFGALLDTTSIATSNKTFTFPNTTGTLALVAGSDTQVLFNDGGMLGGDAGLTYNKTTDFLSINGTPFGKGAGTGSIIIGTSATTTGNHAVAIGNTANAGAANATALGGFATATGTGSTVVGYGTAAEYGVAVGNGGGSGVVAGTEAVAVGKNTEASDYAVVVGTSSEAGTTSVAIGRNCNVTGTDSIGIGDNIFHSSNGAIGIGSGATVDGTNAIAVGAFAFAEHNYSLALGKDSRSTTTNQIVFGADTNDSTGFSELWWGQSTVSTQNSPFSVHVTRRATSVTNGGGNDFTLNSGAGTGNSTTGGSIIFKTPNEQVSGTTQQALTTRLTIGRNAITSTLDITVPDEAYDATAWNGSLEVPTKNAVRDKFESLTPLAIGSTITSATQGSVLFAGASGVLAQDNANFFYNDSLDRLFLGGTTAYVSSTFFSSRLQSGIASFGARAGTLADYGLISLNYVNGSANNYSTYGGLFDARYNGTGTGTSVRGIEVVASIASASVPTATAIQGGSFSAQISSSGNGATTIRGVYAEAGAGASGGTVATMEGVRSTFYCNNSSTITAASLFKTAVSTSGTGSFGTLTGLDLSEWGTSTVGTSYGIYMDTSIDRGTTAKYAIYSLSTSPSVFTGTVEVPDDAYDATSWNGNNTVPTKNALRDKFESLAAGSGITRTVVVTSGSVTMGSSASTDYTYFVSGAHTLSLPAAASNTNRYTVKNNHSANITVDTAGAENVEGAASISIAPGESVDLASDATNWWVI
jgi:hypothetical protein